MDETYNILQLLNKDNIKPKSIIDYQRTTGNYQPSKPSIKRNIKAENSIIDYYIKQTTQPSVNPNAFLKYKVNKRSSQNLKFESKNKQQLLNDLKTGQGNYANEYVHYMPAYMKSKTPILKNNSLVASSLSSGVAQAPNEKQPYDTLTQDEMEDRERSDEALMSRLQQTRARMNDKLDESEENSNSHMEKMKKLKDIKENISSKKIQNVVKERIKRKKLEGVTRAIIATSSKSKDDDNSDGSIETNLEDTENNNVTDEEKSFLDEIFDFDLFGSEDEELESTNQRDSTFFNKKKNTSVADNNEINIIDEKEKIDSSNEEKKIIDAVISEKEGSLD